MWPLVDDMIHHPIAHPATDFGNIRDLRVLWMPIVDGFGLDIFYTLERDTWLFFQYPVIKGHFTYINGFLYFMLVLLFIVCLYRLVRSKVPNLKELKHLFHNHYSIQFFVACYLLYVLLFVLRVRIHSHYYIITFPFIQLLAVKIAGSKRTMLIGLLVINSLLSIAFMNFIHVTGGTANSYYGWTYKKSMRE